MYNLSAIDFKSFTLKSYILKFVKIMLKDAYGDLIENTFVIWFCTCLDFLAFDVLFPHDPVNHNI